MLELPSLTIARGQIAPKGYQPLNSEGFIETQKFFNLGSGSPNAGNMRGHLRKHRHQLAYRAQ
jgi:hypothetical protein